MALSISESHFICSASYSLIKINILLPLLSFILISTNLLLNQTPGSQSAPSVSRARFTNHDRDSRRTCPNRRSLDLSILRSRDPIISDFFDNSFLFFFFDKIRRDTFRAIRITFNSKTIN